MTKIVKLEAENFKRLKAVQITPGEHTVVISGNNAQGKSSVLDAIQAALAGKKGVRELVEPIRQGESKARVVLELDDIKVTRTWSPSGSQLVVGPKDGSAKFNGPQAILDKLIGALAFDPLEFAEAAPADQVGKLIEALGVGDEFARIAAERKAAYEERTDVNRAIKGHERTLEHFTERLPSTRPPSLEEMDVAKLSLELEAAIEVERARGRWTEIEQQILELRAEQKRLSDAAHAVVENVKPGPSADIRADLARAAEHNQVVQRFKQVDELVASVDEVREVSVNLTSKIEQLDAEKRSLIANSNLPVEGLSFDEDGITLNGVPFVQASAAERLKVSVAMAMAMNPDLRVICIRDASLLDAASFAAIEAMAVERDYQIWYEVVGDRGEIGVVIEDGEVQGA